LNVVSVHPVQGRVQVSQRDAVASGQPGGVVGGQRGPVLQVGEVVDVDDGDRGLAVLGDRDRTMRIPGPRDQFTQVSPGRCQAIRIVHDIKVYTLYGKNVLPTCQ
jgi:hypothetical protein